MILIFSIVRFQWIFARLLLKCMIAARYLRLAGRIDLPYLVMFDLRSATRFDKGNSIGDYQFHLFPFFDHSRIFCADVRHTSQMNRDSKNNNSSGCV